MAEGRRFPRAELFLNERGQLNEYARRAHLRVLADLFYLARWRQLGAVAAGAETCAQFGHDPRGRVCERCGRPVVR